MILCEYDVDKIFFFENKNMDIINCNVVFIVCGEFVCNVYVIVGKIFVLFFLFCDDILFWVKLRVCLWELIGVIDKIVD